jgi:hypothetical protein
MAFGYREIVAAGLGEAFALEEKRVVEVGLSSVRKNQGECV